MLALSSIGISAAIKLADNTATKIIFPNSTDHIKECETDLLILTKDQKENTEMLPEASVDAKNAMIRKPI